MENNFHIASACDGIQLLRLQRFGSWKPVWFGIQHPSNMSRRPKFFDFSVQLKLKSGSQSFKSLQVSVQIKLHSIFQSFINLKVGFRFKSSAKFYEVDAGVCSKLDAEFHCNLKSASVLKRPTAFTEPELQRPFANENRNPRRPIDERQLQLRRRFVGQDAWIRGDWQ